MTFFTQVWSGPTINDYRSIADEQTKVYPPNVERRGEKRLILILMSNTLCLSKLRSGTRRDAMLSNNEKHAEDAARQFDRTERDEAQVVVARTTAQVTAAMQSRTRTLPGAKNFVSPADVAASGDDFRSNSSSRGSPSKFCR